MPSPNPKDVARLWFENALSSTTLAQARDAMRKAVVLAKAEYKRHGLSVRSIKNFVKAV